MLLSVDVLILGYFVASTFLPFSRWIEIVDMAIGVYLLVELAGRIAADSDRLSMLSKPLTVVDAVIIASLFMPATMGNFAFLRILRSVRLLRSYVVMRDLRGHVGFIRRNEEIVFSALNLVMFIFVVTAFVFVMQEEANPSIENYVDALYFTITTLTTTGFGDITLVGSSGRLLSVAIMIVGVALFLRLVQAIFRPNKIRYECPGCGLTRHELDAVHCKHCGRELHIRTEGTL